MSTPENKTQTQTKNEKPEQRVMALDFVSAFSQLSVKEKLYTYYLTESCWAGWPIVLFQVSIDSPALFVIFQSFYTSLLSQKSKEEIKILNIQDLLHQISQESTDDCEEFIKYSGKFMLMQEIIHILVQRKFFLN